MKRGGFRPFSFWGEKSPIFHFAKKAQPTVSFRAGGGVRLQDQHNPERLELTMGKRDELIAKYADDLKNKCKMTPDMDLLTKVTIGCGPAIYSADSETVAASQASELELVKNNFLIKKLGLKDGPELMAAINAVIETYGKSERNKYRPVVYYMLTKHFGKEKVYK
jgi:hypothetical protein